MKNTSLKRLIYIFSLIALIGTNKVFAQNESAQLHGTELCESIYEILGGKGFSIEKQDLIPSDSTSFPQNLTITISAGNGDSDTKKWYDSSINTIIFSFTQEFAYKDLENLTTFIDKLKMLSLPYDAIILLTANDDFPGVPGLERNTDLHPTGSVAYLQSIGYMDTACAIVVSERRGNRQRALIAGGSNDVSPLYLVRTIYECMMEKGWSPNLPRQFKLLYKLGLAYGDVRTSLFLKEDIPAAGLILENTAEDFNLLSDIAEELGKLHMENWDRHYQFMNLFNSRYWIGEAFYIVLFILTSLVVLLLIIPSTILASPRRVAMRKDIVRTWYFFPIIIAITFLSLTLSQRIFAPTKENSALLFIALKVFSTLLLLFILFIVQISLNFKVSIKASGYHMMFVAALNIFIFSYIDISLLPFLIMEFLIFRLTERMYRATSMIIMTAVPLVPFFFIMTDIMHNTLFPQLTRFVDFTWRGNLLFSLLLFPIVMQIQRILIALDLFEVQKKRRKRQYFLYAVISAITLSVLLAILYAITYYLVSDSTRMRRIPFNITMEEKDCPDAIRGFLTETEMQDLTLRELSIVPDKNVMRYDITIESDSGVPLLESNYDYILETGERAHFIIPDYPTGPLDLVYSSDSKINLTITADAYIQGGREDGWKIYKYTLIIETLDREE